MEFTILGQKVTAPMRQLETFPAPELVKEVVLSSYECTSLCPVTGQPDWYTVTIRYAPRGKCLESKSLKLYLWSFREEGHFCEELSSIIAQDVMNVLDAHWVEVSVKSTPRGGIYIESVASRPRRSE